MSIRIPVSIAIMVLALFSVSGSHAFADSKKGEGSFIRAESGKQVLITETGKILVRGAEVTSVSGSTITAKTTLGAVTLTWTVNTGSTTAFSVSEASGKSIADITTGDRISFAGMLTGGTTVDASMVHEKNIPSRTGFSGTIQGLTSTGFTLAPGNAEKPTRTVSLTGSTTVTINGVVKSVADLKNGDTVNVVGVLSADAKTIQASAVIVGSFSSVKAEKEKEQEDKGWKSFFKNGKKKDHRD